MAKIIIVEDATGKKTKLKNVKDEIWLKTKLNVILEDGTVKSFPQPAIIKGFL